MNHMFRAHCNIENKTNVQLLYALCHVFVVTRCHRFPDSKIYGANRWASCWPQWTLLSGMYPVTIRSIEQTHAWQCYDRLGMGELVACVCSGIQFSNNSINSITWNVFWDSLQMAVPSESYKSISGKLLKLNSKLISYRMWLYAKTSIRSSFIVNRSIL